MGLKKNNMSFEILKPFGPSIVKIEMSNKIITEINDYVDHLIIDENNISKLNHGKYLAGNVTSEFRLDIEFMKKIKWAEFLASSCKKWLLEGHDITLSKFEIISGVGYLKVPNEMGKTFQNDKTTNQNGKLVLIDGSKRFVCNPTYTITPKVGDFYLFPSYMMHAVYPFIGTSEERRSISFNAKIDDDAARLK